MAHNRYIDNIVQHSYNLTVSEHKTTLMEGKDMPRVNLAITQELYDQIEKAAKKENVTVNYYICDMLEERFGKRTVYDYTLAINNMIAEAKTSVIRVC